MNARSARVMRNAKPGALPHADASTLAAVDAAMLDMAYGRLRQSVWLTVLSCLAFVSLFSPFFPTFQILVWVGVMLVISALRFVLWHSYNRSQPVGARCATWRNLFFTTAVCAGAGWALGPIMLIPQAGGSVAMLLILSVLSVSAVSMSALGAQRAAMLAFQVVALVPCVLILASRSDPVESLAALVLFACMMALMIVGSASYTSTRALLQTEMQLSRAVEENREAREKAEAASHAKTRFLANMSHELRSPLNAVIGAAQLMKAGEREPEHQEQLVDAIQLSGTNLLGLIDNILDISRIEAGEFKLIEHDFHLFDCVDAAMATAGLIARAKGLRLACIVDPHLPPWRHGDSERLRQILLNLLGNAVKFTSEGEVVVRLQPGVTSADVRVTVSDTGVGIEAHALSHVFEPFRQGDDSAKRRFGGSGLGLAIVRQLVNAMRGSVAVRSEPGQGAVFELVLPLSLSSAPNTNDVLNGGERMRVAYVEPHAASADALHALLLRMDCDVRRCVTEADVRDWHQQLKGDLCNAWLLMCTDSASAMASALSVQVVALFEPHQIIGMSAREAGVPGHCHRIDLPMPSAPGWAPGRTVVKPVSRSALVSHLVRPPLRQAGAVTAAAALQVEDAGDAPDGARVLVVEDDALNRTIVTRMLQHGGYRVSAVPDGYSALAALANGVFDLVLMDWQMPDLDGLEVTRRLRAGAAGDQGRQVPIVALTANAFAEDRDACLRAGMNDFLSKPVLASSLTAAVARWTRQPARSVAATAPKVDERVAAT